jgi:hypothetical protein
MPKRKAVTAAPSAPAAKPRGGAGRGQGRSVSEANRPGADDPSRPKKVQTTLSTLLGVSEPNRPGADESSRPRNTQATLSSLLGVRLPKTIVAVDVELTANKEPDLTWDYVEHAGSNDERFVKQRQRVRGRVQYDMDKEALAIVLAKGPEVYFVDKNDQEIEVQPTHENAAQRERHNGFLNIQVEKDGVLQAAQWVSWATVKAVEALGAAGGSGGGAGELKLG